MIGNANFIMNKAVNKDIKDLLQFGWMIVRATARLLQCSGKKWLYFFLSLADECC